VGEWSTLHWLAEEAELSVAAAVAGEGGGDGGDVVDVRSTW